MDSRNICGEHDVAWCAARSAGSRPAPWKRVGGWLRGRADVAVDRAAGASDGGAVPRNRRTIGRRWAAVRCRRGAVGERRLEGVRMIHAYGRGLVAVIGVAAASPGARPAWTAGEARRRKPRRKRCRR